MRFPFGKSGLRRAIERGLANANLDEELKELGDLSLKSRTDGEDVCWALRQLDGKSREFSDQTYAIAGLFQHVASRDCAAFEILQERGVPELLSLFDEIINLAPEKDANTLLFILKILGLYGTVAGTLKIVEAARRPLKPDGYMWSPILRTFTAGHPERDLLYNSLRHPLPGGFIDISLLDAANAILTEGNNMPHPFDSPAGKQKLRDLLVSPDSEEFSYAKSATAALPFISDPEQEALLSLAMNHPDASVQIEAAWAAARLGRDEGVQRLAAHCHDFKTAESAKRYLSELGREDAVPPAANRPDFVALAEFAKWLSHPNELGRMPDELTIIDNRELNWPPEWNRKPFWLIKYTLRDMTGLEGDNVECGLVGSVTFCLFSYELAQRPPEDAYAIHCYWELEGRKQIEESDVAEAEEDYRNLLAQWSGPPLENAEMLIVAELSPELKYPQRLVGLASAQLNNQPGWVVLDGSRSEWYPQSEQPPDTYKSVVLKVHVGRNLLGFTERPDRKRFIAPARPPRPAEQIIGAYEKLLSHARRLEGKKQKDAYRGRGLIGKHFADYVEALASSGRSSEVSELIATMAPHWENVTGYSKLGTAAFKSGHWDLAEGFFLKYRDECTNYERGDNMGFLADLWCRKGKQAAAEELLLDCLIRLLQESKTATGSDKALFEKWFQNQRRALLQLFPTEGEAILKARGIPQSTKSPEARETRSEESRRD